VIEGGGKGRGEGKRRHPDRRPRVRRKKLAAKVMRSHKDEAREIEYAREKPRNYEEADRTASIATSKEKGERSTHANKQKKPEEDWLDSFEEVKECLNPRLPPGAEP